MVEHAGEALSRYEVESLPGTNKLRAVTNPKLFETSYHQAQLGLFQLNYLGDSGWLKALKLEEYSPRRLQRSQALQDVLFPYLDAL